MTVMVLERVGGGLEDVAFGFRISPSSGVGQAQEDLLDEILDFSPLCVRLRKKVASGA